MTGRNEIFSIQVKHSRTSYYALRVSKLSVALFVNGAGNVKSKALARLIKVFKSVYVQVSTST